MAKGSRKKRRPSGNAGSKKKNATTGKDGGDDPAPPPPPTVPSVTSVDGEKNRPDDDSEIGNTASSAGVGPSKRARGREAGSSTDSSGLSLGKGADIASAVASAVAAAAAVGGSDAAAAPAAADGAAVRGEEVRASNKGEGSPELASSSAGGGAESAAVPESGAAPTAAGGGGAGLAHETVSEDELDASMCNEMDEWIAVDRGGSAPEGGASPLQPRGDDAHENVESRIPEDQTNASAAEASAATVAAAAAAVDGEKDGAGETPDQATALSLQGSDDERISIGTEVKERSASVEVVPQAPTAPAIAEEVRVEKAEESSEPPAATAAPPLDVGAASPVAALESPLEAGSSAASDRRALPETASLTATSDPAPERGSQGQGEPALTNDTGADTVGGAIVETLAPAAAATVPIASASEPPAVAITADSALPVAGRDNVDGAKGPQPPPSAALTARCAAAGDGATGTSPASDASKEDVAAGGEAGSGQSVAVAEVLPEQAPASADAVTEGTTVQATTGGSVKEKAAAAKAAAEAATAAAVLASADAASAAEAAAVAIADAKAALEAVAEAEAVARLSSAEREGAETTATPTTSALSAAATAAEECVAAGPSAADEGKTAQERTTPRTAAAASDASAGPAAPPLAAFPPLFLETRTEPSEAAPAGATILTGSVSADVFSSRSAAGPRPWPGSSDGSSDGGGDDGFGGSSRHRMSVKEAAAFMNLGSTGSRGDAFASGSSWATTGTSVIDTSAASAEVSAVPVLGAAGGGAPGGAFSSAGSASRHGSLRLGGGAPFDTPFVGLDDFLSPASVGGIGGLDRRRVSADAVVLQGFSSGGGVALDVRDFGVRRSTVSEMVSRVGDSSGTARVLVGEAAVGGLKTSAVVDGASTGRSDDGGTGSMGRVRSSASTKEEAADESPSAAEEAEKPALLVRKDERRGGGTTAVVEAAVSVEHGRRSAAVEGGTIVKNSDSGGGFADGDSAATSCAGGEGGVGSPSRSRSRGAGAEPAVPGPNGTTSSGGCCVVS